MKSSIVYDKKFALLVNPADALKQTMKIGKIIGKGVGNKFEPIIRKRFFSSLKHPVPLQSQAALWRSYKKHKKYKFKVYSKSVRKVKVQVGAWISFAQLPAIFLKSTLLTILQRAPLRRTKGRFSLLGEPLAVAPYFLGRIGKNRAVHMLTRPKRGDVKVTKRHFDIGGIEFFSKRFEVKLLKVYRDVFDEYLKQYTGKT